MKERKLKIKFKINLNKKKENRKNITKQTNKKL